MAVGVKVAELLTHTCMVSRASHGALETAATFIIRRNRGAC